MSTNRVALQLKSSALRAGISALPLLLIGLVVPPLRALLNRAFDGNWGTIDGRVSLEAIGALSGLWFAVMFVSNFLDLRTSDRREEAANPSFGPTAFVRFIFSLNVGLSALLVWGLRKEHDPAWLQWICLSFALLAFFGWPRAITLDEAGIHQRSLFGSLRTIPYNQVEYITYDPTDQTTLVVGGETRIKHMIGHSDRALFQALIEERTHKAIV